MRQNQSRYHRHAIRLRTSCAALALTAGVALLALPGSARAGDNSDSSDSSSFYNKTLGRVLEGFGLKKGDDSDDIHYGERPPLALPSSRDLPPPEKKAATLSPAWPKDPDVKRRKLIEEQQKNRMTSDQREHEQNPLSPSELAPGPRPRGVTASNTGPGRSGATDFGETLSPSALGYKGGLFGKMFHGKDGDVAQFTGEPPRTELTEPPPGYQTPSPDQPYGVGQARAKADNDFMTRGELKR
jgi:hypothetical protein